MANTVRKTLPEGASSRPRPAPGVRLAGPQDAAAGSPALHRQELLQETLEHLGEGLGEPPGDTGRWSQRRTLALIGLTCGGFWTCVIVGLAHLAHHG
jgi:hypothetical protein